jgi:hypothetical protein
MAKVKNGLYVPDKNDKQLGTQGGFIPEPEVSGRRFEPDGNGGGILYIRTYVERKGFRKPVETWVGIRKATLCR